jgi:hypothetical protein
MQDFSLPASSTVTSTFRKAPYASDASNIRIAVAYYTERFRLHPARY